MNKQYLKGLVKTEKGSNQFNVIASTATIDRQGESIDQAGWDLTNFLKNPVILWAHDYSSLPIGIAESTQVTDQGLVMNGRFASGEANPMADNVRMLYEDGILKTVSVGFIPKERNGNIITKAELLEVSFVPVPANPEALSLALAKGLTIEKSLVELITKAEKEKGEVCNPDSPAYDPAACEAEREREGKEGEEPPVEEKPEETPTAETPSEEAPKEGEEKVTTKPEICKPDSPSYDPAACGAIFCNPESPDYNPEYCDLMKTEDKEKAMATISEKVGRVISAKNRELISTAISTMKQSIASLAELLDATEPPVKGGGTPAGVKAGERSASEGGFVEIPEETLKELLNHSRIADKHNELSNAVIKRILKGNPKD